MPVISLLITGAILAVQYNLGLMKKFVWGMVLPAGMILLFLLVGLTLHTAEYMGIGAAYVLGSLSAWAIGRLNTSRRQQQLSECGKVREL